MRRILAQASSKGHFSYTSLQIACLKTSAVFTNLFLSCHNHERQTVPGQSAIDEAPEPDGLVENLQHHFADVAAVQHFSIEPPRGHSYFIELIHSLDRKTVLLEQSAEFGLVEAALVSESLVQGAEK